MKKTNYLAICLFTLTCFSVSAQKQDPIIDQDNPLKAQVIAQDLVVQGSECVGFDCVNGESFGFDTQRYKENNLRIHFDDTSNSASFPSNDWRIAINDTGNGGASYFAIQDATAGTTPVTVRAGAGNNALFINNSGNVGLGTATPVVELHVTDGDSPTMRLEQSGASGFTPQTWDVAGNETNFFVRDVTNGSALSFRIFPGNNNDDGLVIRNGRVGVFTDNPSEKLHVAGGNAKVLVAGTDGNTNLKIDESSSTVGGRNLLAVKNNGPARFTIENSNGAGAEWQLQAANNGSFGIQDNTDPAEQEFLIDGIGNVTITGSLTAAGTNYPSDYNLKKDVKEFKEGLDVVLKLNPISYFYNGKANMDTSRPYIGLGAQDLQKVAPYMVSDFNFDVLDTDGNLKNTENYLKIDAGAIQYLLVNAIQEQQALLEEKNTEIEVLNEKVEDLNTKFEELQNKLDKLLDSENNSSATLNGKNQSLLSQNIPNPYNTQTKIEYFIPLKSTSAQMQFFDISGKLIKTIDISEVGKGILDLKVDGLTKGTYLYNLVIDNQIRGTKKMIVK